MERNKIIFMTGATSGFGKISALKAAQSGATLIVLARDKVKAEALCTEFKAQYPDSSGKIEIIEGDLSSFDSVYSACEEVRLKFPVIDMIVNNAGIMNFKPKKTTNGVEETLQVNLLSPLLICHLLFENLKKSNDPKIIITSSGLHQGEINFDNLEFNNSFSSFKVYRQSKLGVILICRLLAKSLEKHKVGIYSQHPGMVRTNLGQSAGWFSKMIFYFMGKSPDKGSQTLSFLIETPNAELRSGEYYADKKITKTTKQSYDLEVAKRLLLTIETYLSQYIKSESVIFKDEK
ncbi:MAG: NAD(P)-dependent dehydrogenase (short-subunit alcohol dehydrogenase family) [Crocinitomicaceae bacterium]|jgi:NAD(P)-dependent dehydrogenase (short-subunit alcohol dehydrogenase family)